MSDKEKEIAEVTETEKNEVTSEKVTDSSKNEDIKIKAPKKKKLSKGLCAGIVAIIALISFVAGIIIIDVPIKELFS